MVVYLLYEHLAREWDALQKLKKSLEGKGVSVGVYSIIYERTKAVKAARKNRPDVLVLPWFVDESHEKAIYPFLEVNPGVKIINMHHEEIGCDASDSVFFPKTEYTRNGSYHLSWGSFFGEKLKQHGVNPERIKVTGNIRNDGAAVAKIKRNELAEKYSLDSEKPWILFAENRGYYIQRISDDLRRELNHRGMSNESIDLRANYERESLKVFVEEMACWDEKKRSRFEFIYRPHPGTYALESIPGWMHVIDDLSIYEWINACDLFLTCGSTSIFEAEICGKPCAIFESIDIPDRLKVYGLDEYPVVSRADEIDESLIERLTKQNVKEPRYVKYLGMVDGKAIERTANAIIEIANDDLESENRKALLHVCKPSRKELVRYSIYEKLTYFMTKTNLLYVFKYPRSAYSESKDIPYSRDAKWIR